MIHANVSQLRLLVNEQNLLDHHLKFSWQCSEGEDNQTGATHFYVPIKNFYLRGYNLVQEFFRTTYGTEVSITAEDYCNNWFIIPININLDPFKDNAKARCNPLNRLSVHGSGGQSYCASFRRLHVNQNKPSVPRSVNVRDVEREKHQLECHPSYCQFQVWSFCHYCSCKATWKVAICKRVTAVNAGVTSRWQTTNMAGFCLS